MALLFSKVIYRLNFNFFPQLIHQSSGILIIRYTKDIEGALAIILIEVSCTEVGEEPLLLISTGPIYESFKR